MNSTRVLLFLLLAALLAPIEAAVVLPEELKERDEWTRARCEAAPSEPRADPALVVIANHGDVIKNARAGKPLRIAGEEFTRGLLCHARA